jgi:DNA polymerase IV
MSSFLNTALPTIMHIDLNCCFAIIEQQANRLLRGRPVAVSAYGTPGGMVLASSYEAKRLGVKLGVNNREARQLAPGIAILTPDPAKYREANKRFHKLLLEFTPDVTPKSIDEFVLNFAGSLNVQNIESRSKNIEDVPLQPILDSRFYILNSSYDDHCAQMESIGHQIKQRVKECLGEWVTVNIGIGTNRFLAKYAAGFGKPDGMTLIDYRNLRQMYTARPLYDSKPGKKVELIDLPGINTRYAARLMACGIMDPLQFFEADVQLLKKVVFKSVVGYYWWARLRGHEVDDRTFSTKSIGHQYAIPRKTMDKKDLERLLMKLCEKVGRRLRKKNFCARGIHLYMGFERYRHDVALPFDQYSKPVSNTDVGTTGFDNVHRLSSWHEGHRLNHRLYATSDIYEAARHLLEKATIEDNVKMISITVYDLEPWDPEQLSIFDTEYRSENIESRIGTKGPITQNKYRSQEVTRRLSDAMDAVNTRYGEFVITPGTMLGMKGEILDRIAFANTPSLAGD